MDSTAIGKSLVVLGVVLAIVGLLFMFGDRVPVLRNLGQLPGDINAKGEGWQFYMPIATSLILSVVLSVGFWLLSYFFNRGGR